MSNEKTYQRKIILIDKDFQFKYLLTWIAMTMAMLAGLVLASVSMFFFFKVRAVNHLILGNCVSAIVITALSLRYMLRLSHRIAGPAFRLERVIRQVADGTHTGHVKLRQKDYLTDVANSINYLIDTLEERKQQLTRVRLCARAIQQSLDDDSSASADLKRLTGDIVDRLTEMTQASAADEPIAAPSEELANANA